MALQWNTGSAQIGALPTADATQEGKIFQYTGETDTNFTNGYFYECVEVTPATDPKTYEWKQKNVQDSGSGGTVAFNDITNRPLYDGQPMTSSTVIPYVSNSTVVASNDNTTYTMGGNVTGDVDMELSVDSSDNSVNLRVYDTVSQDVIASKTLTDGAEFELDKTNNVANFSNRAQHLAFEFSNDSVEVTAADPGTYYNSKVLATKDYVDNIGLKTINNSSIKGSGNLNTGKVLSDYQTNSTSIYEGTDNSVQISKDGNDAIRIQGYGEDDRGATKTLYDMSLASKSYVDGKTGTLTNLNTTDKTNLVGAVNEVNGKTGVNMAVGAETWYGTYTDENNVTYQTYTKTIFIPALPSAAGITTYPIGVSGMKQIISISGVTTDGFVLNAPRQTVTDNITIYQTSKGSQTFSIEVGKDRSSKSAYVTIVYAKNN